MLLWKFFHRLLTSGLVWNTAALVLFLLIISGVVLIRILGAESPISTIFISLFFLDLYYLGLARYYQIKIYGLIRPQPKGKNMLNYLTGFLFLSGGYGYIQGVFKPARGWLLLSGVFVLISKGLVVLFARKIRPE